MSKRNIIYLAALIVVLIAIIICLPGKNNRKEKLSSGKEVNEIPAPVINYRYDIPVDSFNLEEIKIRKNEILSKVLLARGINYNQIDKLVKVSKPVFDVRKIIAGHSCTFFWTLDSIPLVKHFVYEKNLEEFITYTIDSTITVSEGRKEISYEDRAVSGVIKSSLWKSLVDMDVSPVLSLEMMDVYQWTLDFAGIQKGDQFKILYDVKMIDGNAVGINRVLASSITNSGKELFAFVFNQNNRFEYFDEEGQSLRRAFLKAPLNYRRISSKYSNSRFHPIQKKYKPHRGIDYAAKAGTEVQTIGDGKVVKIAYDRASGNYIKIKHNAVYTSGYLHLQRRPKLNVGDRVKQGDPIGKVGATGYATGPHLDFRIWRDGQLVNPENVESPPVEPVAQEFRTRYDSIASAYQERLKVLPLSR